MSAASVSPALSPGLILLIDDTLHGQCARRMVLQEMGYAVLAAAGLDEAVCLLAKHPIRLVVTDHKPQSLDGIGIIAVVRQHYPHVPVVLVSGFVEALGLSENSTGAAAVIAKSNNEVAHLTRMVNRLLRPQRKPPRAAGDPLLPGLRRRSV